MSETAVNPDSTPQSFFLDGDAPRLAAGPTPAAAPNALTRPLDAPNIQMPEGAPTLPVVSPVLSSAEARMQPEVAAPAEGDSAAEPVHPMAHLMPAKSKPSEAAKRAAEQRAVKKAKAKKIKIGVAAGFLLVAGLGGPPAFKWLSDAVNEAGGLQTEESGD